MRVEWLAWRLILISTAYFFGVKFLTLPLFYPNGYILVEIFADLIGCFFIILATWGLSEDIIKIHLSRYESADESTQTTAISSLKKEEK